MSNARRLALALTIGSLLTLGTSATASAECMNVRPSQEPISRSIVFVATVTDVVTGEDQEFVDAGEGTAVDWSAALDVTRVVRGSVADRLDLAGTTREGGYGTGCGYFLGDRLVAGDRLLIALDEQIEFATNHSLYGDILVWLRVGDGWAFYADALQEGDDHAIYPGAVRDARTTAEIMAVVAAVAPDTSVEAPADQPTIDPPFALLAIAFLSGLGASVWRLRRRVA